ncbi:MAG: sugar ABC transporter permease [Armatimonadetes bacterium]|nr:sugar ABC transporter permease [Armatimonadota bacterium]MBS1712152.1 sugar ABC transporter permease [Armatimonadota bacterium]MBX3107860.1 sugar ABC transporter permease [Fimbriimonadaceae bacterium]
MAGRDLRRSGFLAACLIPGLILYCGLVLVPFARTIQLSFYHFSGVGSNREWVGLENFQDLWSSEQFWWALRNGLTILIVVAPVLLGFSMVMAHAAQGTGRLAKLVRAVYLFPNLISLVAAGLIWRAVYNPSVGLLKGIGISGPANGWLGDVETAFWAFAIAFIWVGAGFYTTLFVAGLAGIPAEVHEACELEGASGWRKYMAITRPLLWPVRRVAAVHTTIAALGVFALVNIMTEGAPSYRTETLLNALYRSMTTEADMGRASAIGVVMMLLTAATSVALWMLYRRNPTEANR